MNRQCCGSFASILMLVGAGCAASRTSSPSQLELKPQALPAAEPKSSSPELLVSGQSRPRTTIVVDIDDTLCLPDYKGVLWGIGSDDSSPLSCAAKTLRDLAQRYEILYLTARPASVSHRSERWLDTNAFPPGPIVGSRNLIDFLGQTDFKKQMLARLRRQGRNLLIGIGDRPRDAAAYRANGMLPIVVNPCAGARYNSNELILKDWDSISKFFHANQAVLTDPLKLAEGIKTREFIVPRPG